MGEGEHLSQLEVLHDIEAYVHVGAGASDADEGGTERQLAVVGVSQAPGHTGDAGRR